MGIRARKLTEESSVIFSEIHLCMSIGNTVFIRHQTISETQYAQNDRNAQNNVQTKIFFSNFHENPTFLKVLRTNAPLKVILCSIFNFDQLHMFYPFH